MSAADEVSSKLMLAIRRNHRKALASMPKNKVSSKDAVLAAKQLAKSPQGRQRQVPKSPDKPDNIRPSTILNKKPNEPRTLSQGLSEKSRRETAATKALRKSLASTGRTKPKKEITQPEIRKIIRSSKSSKNPRSALEIRKSLEGKVVRTGDRIFMDAWKYVESRINQSNAQTGENTISKSRREAAAREEARQEASADEAKREGVRERRSTRIQISDARRTEENNSSRKVAHPEGESGRNTHVEQTADADIKKTGGQGKYIKPADNPEQGAKNKIVAKKLKTKMRVNDDPARAKALKQGEINIAKERAAFRARVKAKAAAKATETEREAVRASGNGQDSRSASMRRTRARIANTGVGQSMRGVGVGIGGGTLKEMR